MQYNPLVRLAKDYSNNLIRINSISEFIRKPDDEPDRYLSSKGAFMFPIRGECKIYFNDDVYLANPNTIIHGCPNKHLIFEVISNEPFEHINLYYDTPHMFLFDIEVDNMPWYIEKLHLLLDIYHNNDIKSSLQKEDLATSIFEHIFENYMIKDIKNNQVLMDEVVSYIHSHYSDHLTLAQLAAYAGKTPNQFSYLFHLHTGLRPIDYVITFRLKAAMKMLKYDDASINEIASKVGYDDPLYFSRLFKKHLGTAPSQFRNSYTYSSTSLFSNHVNTSV